MRVKGWQHKSDLHQCTKKACLNGMYVYVEEIPPSAIRCEAVVEKAARVSGVDFADIRIDLPAHLIGKKVTCIIIPEED